MCMYMNSHTVYCLLFAVKVSCFSQITLQLQTFLSKFLHVNTMKACKADNLKSFFGNESKDVKQQNCFTANIISNVQYCAYKFMTNNKLYFYAAIKTLGNTYIRTCTKYRKGYSHGSKVTDATRITVIIIASTITVKYMYFVNVNIYQ